MLHRLRVGKKNIYIVYSLAASSSVYRNILRGHVGIASLNEILGFRVSSRCALEFDRVCFNSKIDAMLIYDAITEWIHRLNTYDDASLWRNRKYVLVMALLHFM